MREYDLPFNPKAEKAIDLLTADLMAQIHELGRRKFDIQGVHKVRTFCRTEFGCELDEISIQAAKWVIGHLSQLKDFPRKPLPPREAGTIEGPIAPPPAPVPSNPALWGPKL